MINKIQFILSMIIFGTIGLVVRNIPMDSSEISLISSGIGFTFLLFIFLLQKRKFTSKKNFQNNLPLIIFSSISLAGNWLFLYASYKFTSITNATLAYYFAPILVILFSVLFLKEVLTKKIFMCIICSLIGLYLIVRNGLSTNVSSSDLIGIVLGLSAAFFYASLMITGKYIKKIEKLELTIYQLGFAFFFLLIYFFIHNGMNAVVMDWNSLPFLFTLGIINTALGFWLFFSGMKKLNGQTIAMVSYVDPLVAILISGFILKENLTIIQFIGATLILGSTLISEVQSGFLQKIFKKFYHFIE